MQLKASKTKENLVHLFLNLHSCIKHVYIYLLFKWNKQIEFDQLSSFVLFFYFLFFLGVILVFSCDCINTTTGPFLHEFSYRDKS